MQGSIFTLRYCYFYLSKESELPGEGIASQSHSLFLASKMESFRRPAFTELLDELGEVAESLEPPPKSDLTTSWVVSLGTQTIQQQDRSVWSIRQYLDMELHWDKKKKKSTWIFQPSLASLSSTAPHMTMAELVLTEVVRIYLMCFWRAVETLLTSHWALCFDTFVYRWIIVRLVGVNIFYGLFFLPHVLLD